MRDYRQQLLDDRWRSFLSEIDLHSSPGKAWSVVNSLSRKFVPASKNEALLHNNRLICSPHAKATIFAKSFAKEIAI